MGVEPTAACSAQPAADFEDRGAHRDTSTPTYKDNVTIRPRQSPGDAEEFTSPAAR